MPVPPGLRIRQRTLAAGVVLGAVLLLALGIAGGVDIPAGPNDGAEQTERTGPLAAVQPELRRALLTDQEAGTAAPAVPVAPAATGPVPTAGGPSTAPAPQPERRVLDVICRALFEDPASVPGRWGTDPRQSTSRQLPPDERGTLAQALSIFDREQAGTAYQRLRQVAGSCGRFAATLPDGTPVTVLLEKLTDRVGGQPETAGQDRATEQYAVAVTARTPQETLTGWLALDRHGPVVSVLRQLGPAQAPARDLTELREAVLAKLRQFPQLLD